LDPKPAEIQSEIARRQKFAKTTVLSLMVAAILLSVVALLSRDRLTQRDSVGSDMTIRITILILGLGSIVWRRTKFQAMRLQDIGALQGASGLLKTLERTTLQLAILAALIAVVGFVGTLLMGNEFYTYVASAIALVVLLYAYPTKSSWVSAVSRFS
jgi:uncharacterized membrane protein YhaH (DUF805 family)